MSDTARKRFKLFLELMITLSFALILSVIIQRYILQLVVVPSGSMENTIRINDKLLNLKIPLAIKAIKRGDIIVFKMPDNKDEYYVKRVVGLSGDTIEIKKGILYINKKPYFEEYIKEKMKGDFGPIKVPTGKYFVLGDNRNDSFDSRFWTNKFVSREDIIGKIILRVYPIKRFGFVK